MVVNRVEERTLRVRVHAINDDNMNTHILVTFADMTHLSHS